jgi:hypothetical protein
LEYNKNFDKDPRQIINKTMMPFMDIIYKNVFGNNTKIDRIEYQADYILDRKFAVDTILTLESGCILTGQEKCLTTNFMTLTVEYEQNQYNHEHGDWFNMAAQFYFCGYVNKNMNGFRQWIIADWTKITYMTNKGDIQWYLNQNNVRGLASFKYIKFSELPKSVIIAQG